jgi:hypothetical protein
MSHFTVTVCLAADDMLTRALRVSEDGFPLRDLIQAHLEHVLAPFDENREVGPYRRYEEGGPESYWLYTSLERATEPPLHETDPQAQQALARLLARDPEKTRRELAEQEERRHADAALFRTLPVPVTWADIARLHNDRYGSDEEDALLVDNESGRAYTMSTRNPQAKWDWWVIGGRWPARFPYRKGHDREVIPAEPYKPLWGAPGEPVPAGHCDGGPLAALDLAAMRDEAARRAREEHAEYLAVVAGTPEALPWSVFADNISEAGGYGIDRAREEYNTQPRIKALYDSRDFAFCDNEDFQVPAARYVAQARARAVPGWAVLTTDGRWMEQGSMGWWGRNDATESSRIGYWEAANAYIGSLPGDAWLVSVDCHI